MTAADQGSTADQGTTADQVSTTRTVDYDVVLRGGWIVDGTGAPPFRADIAVAGGRIAAIGRLDELAATNQVDVTDRYLLPGFVDAHVHADAVLIEPQVQQALLRQGVTTVILGQDGLSFAPGGEGTVRFVSDYFAAINGVAHEHWTHGCTVADLLERYDRATPVNVAYLVPLGTVRYEVLGPASGAADDAARRQMRRLVDEALEQGAVGVSTGLEYVPGVFADLDELASLCGTAARHGAPYVSHLRSYTGGAAPGMDELIDLAARTGIPAHASHYRGRGEPLAEHLDRAWAKGIDVTFDSYPHQMSNTILAMKALPPQVQDGGVPQTLARLADPTVRTELENGWLASTEPFLAEAVLGYVGSPEYAWAEGLTLTEASRRAGTPFASFVCDLLIASDLAVGAIMPSVGLGDESDIRALLRHPGHMGCSDGIYLGGHPHPRGWGAFARFLGHHTRELGDWTWGEAAVHLASHPARRFGLADRGLLRAGQVADLAVIDPMTVTDRATYDRPQRLADGVSHVLVAGQLVLADHELTGVAAGRALRRGETGL